MAGRCCTSTGTCCTTCRVRRRSPISPNVASRCTTPGSRSLRQTMPCPRDRGATARDLALHLIGKLGAAAGVGHAIEYAGTTIEALDVEERLTLCNLTVELGARSGVIAPDERTFAYVNGRRFAPQGAEFDAAV